MRFTIATLMLFWSSLTLAHQPVMDMAPRWDQGFGIQTRVEHFDSQTTNWLEGVYTFDKSVRATFKLPYSNGEIGGLILGVPLKKYTNRGARTSNWSVTPSVELPTGSKEDWDAGLSISYSAESPTFYQLYDVYALGDRKGIDINAGFAFPNNGGGQFLLWDVSALSSDEGDRVLTGPVYVYFKGSMMFRAEYKIKAYDKEDDFSGNLLNVGIGFVY